MPRRLLFLSLIFALCALICAGLTLFFRQLEPVRDLGEPAVTGAGLSAPLPDSHAEKLPVHLNLSESEDALNDGDYKTDIRFEGGDLYIWASKPVNALYLIWGSYPDTWILELDGKEYEEGQNGFLHELVMLPEPTDTLILHFPEKECKLCDLSCYSTGILPPSVQQWLPPCEKADLLVFSTHNDDEFVFFGGLLPYYAAVCEKAVQVAYMTTNYYDDDEEDQFRIHEALNGLWFAGVRHYPVSNMQTDRFCETLEEAEELYGPENFRFFQVEQIRRFKPLVIVTQDHDGEYGHGAHQLNARSLEWASYAAADRLMYPELAERFGVWNTPKTYLHLYGPESERTVLDYETPADCFGGLTPYEIAWLAFEKHRSQQKWGFEVYGFNSEYDSHSFGLYRSLVGPDEAKNDLFEHLDDSQGELNPAL